jgi:hypothetical protein
MATTWILMAALLAAEPADRSSPRVADQPAARVAQAPRARNAQRGAPAAPRARRGQNVARPAAANRNTTDQAAQDLIDLIQETVAPSSWEPRGGPGRIRYFAPRQVLVIRQSSEAHEQLDGLLRQLRR